MHPHPSFGQSIPPTFLNKLGLVNQAISIPVKLGFHEHCSWCYCNTVLVKIEGDEGARLV